MKVFISYTLEDMDFVMSVQKELQGKDITVKLSSDQLSSENSWEDRFYEITSESEIYIPILSKDSLESQNNVNEFVFLSDYVWKSNGTKLILPIKFNNVTLRGPFHDWFCINHDSGSEPITDLVNKLKEHIYRFKGRQLAKKQDLEKLKESIDDEAPNFVFETKKRLIANKKKFNQRNNFWSMIGVFSLIAGIVLGLYFICMDNNINYKIPSSIFTTKAIISVAKSGMIMALLILISKHSFDFAKTYLSESLKISNKIHAIEYGQFYIKVFKTIDKRDFKDIFKNWNIDNETSFEKTETKNVDSDFLGKLINLVKTINQS